MPDPRPLSQRFDLSYVRRRTWPQRWVVPLSLLLTLAALGYALAANLRGDKSMYSPGPLTHSHAMFSNDCGKCHQPDPRRAGFWLPVRDDACLSCHAAPAHEPHGFLYAGSDRAAAPGRMGFVKMSGDCSRCHVEHRGREHDVNRIDDQYCTACHADLPGYTHEPTPGTAASVVAFADRHPQWRLLESKRIDTTPLRFEHRVHMNPDTPQMAERLKAWTDSLKAQGVPESRMPVTLRIASVTAETVPQMALLCAACHEPDAAGRYMKPVAFERHCAPCHSLGTRENEPIPHGASAMAFIDRIAVKKVLAAKEPAPKKPSGPGNRGAAAPTPTTLDQAPALVEKAKNNLTLGIKTLCARCHGTDTALESIPAPRVPERWLERSVFSHRSHANMTCEQCHPQASAMPVKQADSEDDSAAKSAPLAWTGRTKEVMLPGIDTCRSCHTPSSGARNDCVLCHQYHGREESVASR